MEKGKCARKGCQTIMSNTYISGIGYICSNCEKEFKKTLSNVDQNIIVDDNYLKRKLKLFLNNKKVKKAKTTINNFFNKNKVTATQ